MKIGSDLQFEVPDNCNECVVPEDHKLSYLGQGSICIRCPILISKGDDALVEPEEFRNDWAECWQEFFKNPKGQSFPDLRF